MSRTVAPLPQDRSMWRRLLRRVHPDHGGEHDLFVWTQALREHVAGDHFEDVRTGYQRRQPPQRPPEGSHNDRLDFTAAYRHASFADLTRHALQVAERLEPPYRGLLTMLASCYAAPESDLSGWRAQHVGASYRQLAYVAHLSGMSAAQRSRWYRICESVPLAQRHAGHLIRELQARAA